MVTTFQVSMFCTKIKLEADRFDVNHRCNMANLFYACLKIFSSIFSIPLITYELAILIGGVENSTSPKTKVGTTFQVKGQHKKV